MPNGNGNGYGAKSKRGKGEKVGEQRYAVKDTTGKVIAVHVRREYANGAKDYVWEQPDGTPGLGGAKASAMPLYGSQALPKLAEQGVTVVELCEGEKAADALRARGYVALGTVTGASATPDDEVLATLKGFTVRLWPDNHDPGAGHMDRIARALLAMGVTVLMVDWKDAPPKGDAADFRDSDEEFRALLDSAEPHKPRPKSESGKPDPSDRIIYLDPDKRAQECDHIQRVLREHHREIGLYDRGRAVVQVVVVADEDNQDRRIHREPGAVIVRPASTVTVEDALSRKFQFRKLRGRDHWAPVYPPEKHAKILVARGGDRRLHEIVGICAAPFMRDDGSICDTPGYDEQTGLYFDAGGTEWLSIPENPTREQVAVAVEMLKTPFAEFPYVSGRDGSDASVPIVATATAIQRGLLENAPAFDFDGPDRTVGKTLLANTIARIATGKGATSVAFPADDEPEMRKLMTTVLMAGDPVIAFDNIVGPFKSGVLAKVLTDAEHADRLLGVNKDIKVPVRSVIFATGVNLILVGDMPSRFISCRIDPECEHPEERTFKIDLATYIPEHRAELVQAALTILKGHYLAGRPWPAGLKHNGKYPEWDKRIRAAIVWAGLPDPYRTRERVDDADPDRAAAIAVLSTWFEVLGPAPAAVATVIKAAADNDALRTALMDVAGTKDGVNGWRLGQWCREYADRIVGGFKLSRAPGKRSATNWKVANVEVSGVLGVSPLPTRENIGGGDRQQGEGVNEVNGLGINSPNSPNSHRRTVEDEEIDRLAAADADTELIEDDDQPEWKFEGAGGCRR